MTTTIAPATAQCSGRTRADLFARFVSNILPHAGRDEALPMLTNILVRHHSGGHLSVEASDRYTWARHRWECAGCQIDDELCADTEWAYAVNAKALADVAKQSARASSTGDVEFGFDGGMFCVSMGAGSFTLPGIEGDADFPVRAVDSILKREPGEVPSVSFMVEHLRKFAKYKGQARTTYPLVFEFGAKPRAAVVVTGGDPDDGFTAMIQPVHDS